MRVLVTGHKGYIGTVMVPFLRARGHEVAGIDTGLFEACVSGPGAVEVPDERLDIRDVEARHLEGFDAVAHLAALSNDPLGDLEPEHTYDINHHASVRLARLAKRAGVERFLYSSSCSIYGAAGESGALDETAPMNPVTPYAESKVQVEGEISAMADDAFSPTSLRNATAYGWSPRVRADLVLNDLVARAHFTGRVTVLSDGTPWRPIVHVEDICRAFAAVLEAPREAVHDQALNVGSAADNYQIRDLAEIVAEVVGDCEIEITGEHGADPRSYRVDFSRITERVPGFRPAWTARKGAEELLGAYRANELTEAAFAGRFRRLPWLMGLRERREVGEDLRPLEDGVLGAGGADADGAQGREERP